MKTLFNIAMSKPFLKEYVDVLEMKLVHRNMTICFMGSFIFFFVVFLIIGK